MKIREFWLGKLEEAWRKHSVVWLSGVRRTGKTYLARSLHGIEYFDCELPRIRRTIEDPESFLNGMHGKTVVLDEIHRLSNPSEILKIAADHYSDIRVLATGSSTLGASHKFKDTLTGRKSDVWLTPMNSNDLVDFGRTSIKHRLLFGGLPAYFQSREIPESEFQAWMDSYWAKDIQELFRLERKQSFQKFVELILMRSGSLFEASKYSAPCEVSRPTIANYLAVLEATFVAHVIKPFSSHKPTEIVSAPKVYAFDTGFAAYYRGWSELHTDELGIFWEHLVLNEMHSKLQTRRINYWRDKHGHKIDFVLDVRGRSPVTIECKWKAAELEAANLKSFRTAYPEGKNYVVASDVDRKFTRTFAGVKVEFINIDHLADVLVPSRP